VWESGCKEGKRGENEQQQKSVLQDFPKDQSIENTPDCGPGLGRRA